MTIQEWLTGEEAREFQKSAVYRAFSFWDAHNTDSSVTYIKALWDFDIEEVVVVFNRKMPILNQKGQQRRLFNVILTFEELMMTDEEFAEVIKSSLPKIPRDLRAVLKYGKRRKH